MDTEMNQEETKTDTTETTETTDQAETKQPNPPAIPWERGNPGYKMFTVNVDVVEDTEGFVYSTHRFADDDMETLASLGSGGLEQSAFGLVSEAVRRTCLVEALLRMSDDEQTFIDDFIKADEAKKQELAMELANKTMSVLSNLVGNISLPVANEVLYMIESNVEEIPVDDGKDQ
jgi:hypothetical protein